MSLSALGLKSTQQSLLPNMMNNRGLWNSNTNYAKNDAVISPQGKYAVAMVAQSGNNPDTANPNPWLVATGGGGGGNQGLLWNPVTATLTITQGGNMSVPLTSLYQNLSFDVSGVSLSISNGNTLSIDAPQLLDISGSALSITRGNTITLPTTLVQDLSFNNITNILSITGGNSVLLDISGATPSDWSLYPAVSNVDISGFSVLNALTYQINNPGASNSFDYIDSNADTAMNTSVLYIERDRQASAGNPVGANFIVESHWYKEDPNPSLNQDFTFRIWQDGDQTYMRQAWELSGNNPPPIYTSGGIELQAVPVSVSTGQANGSGFVVKSTANGWANLYTDSNGDLYTQASSNAGSNWGTAIPLTTPFATLKTQLIDISSVVVYPLSNVASPSNYLYQSYSNTFSNWSATPTDAYLQVICNGAIAGSNGSGTPHDIGFLEFYWERNGSGMVYMDNPGIGFPCLPIGNTNLGSWSITAFTKIPGLVNTDNIGIELRLTTSSPLIYIGADYTSSTSTPLFGTLTPI